MERADNAEDQMIEKDIKMEHDKNRFKHQLKETQAEKKKLKNMVKKCKNKLH